MLFLNPRIYPFNPARGFWCGVGAVLLLWAFRHQLRPVAVKGAKGLIFLSDGVKHAFNAGKEGLGDVVTDAQENMIRQKMESLDLDKKQLAMLKGEVGRLTQQISMLNKVLAEGVKEKTEDESL